MADAGAANVRHVARLREFVRRLNRVALANLIRLAFAIANERLLRLFPPPQGGRELRFISDNAIDAGDARRAYKSKLLGSITTSRMVMPRLPSMNGRVSGLYLDTGEHLDVTEDLAAQRCAGRARRDRILRPFRRQFVARRLFVAKAALIGALLLIGRHARTFAAADAGDIHCRNRACQRKHKKQRRHRNAHGLVGANRRAPETAT
jgi:hypothetical protein